MKKMSVMKKVKLHRRLFHGNQTRIAKEWDYKQWAPVCENEWSKERGCEKGNKKNACKNCDIKKYSLVSDGHIKEHILGTNINKKTGHIISYGQYVLLSDGTCKFAAIDFDDCDFEDVISVWNHLNSYPLPAYIARSSKRGWHLYLFFEEAIDAKIVKKLLHGILEHEKFDHHPEVFPKQTSLQGMDFGNLIKPPLIEPRVLSGRNCWVDIHDVPIGKNADDIIQAQWEYTSNIKKIPLELVKEAAEDFEEWTAPVSKPRTMNIGKAYTAPMKGDFKKVLDGCHALNRIFKDPLGKKSNKDWVTHPMRVALLTNTLHTKNGVSMLREVMPAVDTDWDVETKMDHLGELKGHPELEKNIEYFYQQGYRPETCKKLQELGACTCTKGNGCFKKTPPKEKISGHWQVKDVPESEWPEPSPNRYAFQKNKTEKTPVHIERNWPKEVDKIVSELESAPDTGSEISLVKDLKLATSYLPESSWKSIWKKTKSKGGGWKEFSSSIQAIRDSRKSADKPNTNIPLYELCHNFLNGLQPHLDVYDISLQVFDWFIAHGGFFYIQGDRPYLMYENVYYEISNNRLFNSLLNRLAHINYAIIKHRFFWEGLANNCLQKGKELETRSWTYASRIEKTVYINIGNGELLQIAPNKICSLKNGDNEVDILLHESKKLKPFRYIEDQDITEGINLFDEIILKNLSCGHSWSLFIATWFLMTFILDFVIEKVLLYCSGETQSGKTTGMRLFGLLLYGQDIVKQSSVAANYSDAALNPFMVLDNIEKEQQKPEMLQFLLVLATGIVKEKRALNSDSGVVEERLRAIAAITAIEKPSLPEIINRLYDITFGVDIKEDFLADEVELEIITNRDKILSALLKLFAHEILPSIDDPETGRKAIFKAIRTKYPKHSKSRSDGFLSYQVTILQSLLKHLKPVNGNYHQSALKICFDWIEKQNASSKENNAETNQTLHFLDLLVDEYVTAWSLDDMQGIKYQSENQSSRHSSYTDAGVIYTTYLIKFIENYALQIERVFKKDSTSNKIPIGVEFTVSSAKLLSVFQKLGKKSGTRCKYNDANHLTRRLKNEMGILNENGWKITVTKKTINGIAQHLFMREVDWLEAQKCQNGITSGDNLTPPNSPPPTPPQLNIINSNI